MCGIGSVHNVVTVTVEVVGHLMQYVDVGSGPSVDALGSPTIGIQQLRVYLYPLDPDETATTSTCGHKSYPLESGSAWLEREKLREMRVEYVGSVDQVAHSRDCKQVKIFLL